MQNLLSITVFIIVLSSHLGLGWDSAFKFTPCYEKRMEERMPLSIDNLIAIVEEYERNDFSNDPADIANALLYRYHRSGVIYDPNERTMWSLKQKEEISKQKLDDLLLKPYLEFPEDSFQPREECSLHMMLSHSTDDYPHSGVDYPWENNYYQYSRKRRSTKERYVVLPDGVEPADHPIENGVLQTRAGPVSGRLLLAGIMNIGRSESYTVGELVGSDKAKSYMPSEMISKKVDSLYGPTISGELAQAALLTGKTVDYNNFEIGPIGLFGNCTACARLFSLENNEFSYISRAEVFGAVDGFIIAKYLNERSSSRSMKLSEILRMYYGNHGLYNPELKACNRKNIFNKYQSGVKNDIEEQALNYMYAYQDQYDDVQSIVASYQDDFETIEQEFMEYLDPVVSTFFSFMSSYSYDDPGYEQCPNYNSDDVMAETQADLVVVYSPTGGITEITKQMEYISLTARYIGVGYHRSRLAVLNGKTEDWLSPMTNYSNVADYACNYTTLTDYSSSSSQDFLDIMDKLTTFYERYYSYLRQDLDKTGRNSQIVLWNLPSSFDGDEDEMLRAWDTFNLTYPDVTFMFAGTKDSQLDLIYNNDRDNEDEKIFISTSPISPEEIARSIVTEIQKAPRMFLYAACDTLMVAYADYNEGNHIYNGYITPNFTTFIRIPAQNFHFSEYVKLMFDDDDTRVCLSRVNKNPSDNDDTTETHCEDTPFEYEQRELCGRYVQDCDPIYISVRGSSDSNSDCSDEECQYPNQINYEMRHEGMVCGVWGMLPSNGLLFLVLLILTALSKS